ncbi:MAG TPA: hypothetical protein VLF43_04710 [Candidatus Saccharimonadales bacterium]|nr:hypothetical protein [Candidatus Saccharimonadales bacterium]
MKGNNLSFEASVNNLKRFFAFTEGISITPEQIYVAAGRDLSEKDKNKSWLSNKTHGMKHHELFVKKYAIGGFHEFNRLELTEKGRKALGRNKPTEVVRGPNVTIYENDGRISVDGRGSKLTPQEVLEIVEELADENPGFRVELIFEPKKKEEPVV